MKPLFTYVAVTLAVVIPATELAALYTRMADEARCPKQCYAAVLQERPRFDVGSHWQGYGFIQQGPIRIVF